MTEDTPDYGTEPQRNVQDAVSPEAEAPLMPAHPAHLDPNTFTPDEEGGGSTGLCAICNNMVMLAFGTQPENWLYTAKDWALQPAAPWKHVSGEGEAAPLGSLLVVDERPAGSAPLSFDGPFSRILAIGSPDGTDDLSYPTPAVPEETVHEIEIARFVRVDGSVVPNIESRTVSVAAHSLQDAQYLALSNNEGWALVATSVLDSDPVEMEFPTPFYDQPNIVSVSDDDTEHPREDPSAAPVADETTEGDK